MTVSPRSARWTAATLTGLAACFALAGDPGSEQLLKMRDAWRAQSAKETRQLRDQYVERLAQLERKLALDGDYAGASRVRREREKVAPSAPAPEKTAPASPAAVPDGAPVELKAASASLSGGVTLDTGSGALTGWKNNESRARWKLPPGLKLGGYEVELTWSCAADGGGDMLVREDRYSLSRPVKPTGGWDDFQTQVVGTLRVVTNSRQLEVSAGTVKAPGLFQLKSVRLLPPASRKP